MKPENPTIRHVPHDSYGPVRYSGDMTEHTRRRFLVGAAGAGTVALAGCLSGGGGSADLDRIDPADRPMLGDADAPVTLTVFEDFSCPACRQFKSQFTPQIVDQFVEPGQARYFHADFPLPVDSTWSFAVASAAREVFAEAGDDGFWEFSTAIYDHQGSYSLDVIEEVADDAAGVGAAAAAAADDLTHQETVEADKTMGEEWGVGGTPSVFVDEQPVENDLGEIARAIDDAQ